MTAAVAPTSAAPVAAPSAPPAPTYAPPACRNCGVAMTSRFCPDCGQRAVLDRLTVGSLATDFAGQFLALDRGLWFTALAVVRSPGGVARRWLDGQRRRFIGPIGFLSFAAALFLLGMSWAKVADIEDIRKSVHAATAGPHPLFTPRQAEAYVQLMYSMSQQELLVSVLLAVPFAVIVRRLFRRTGVNLAEAGVMSLYAFADACLLYLPLMPLIRLFAADSTANHTLRLGGTFAVYAIATVHAGLDFFGRRAGTVVRVLVALGVTFGTFFVIDAIGSILYIELTVPR